MSTFCPAKRAYYWDISSHPIFVLVLPLATPAQPCHNTPTSSTTKHPTCLVELRTRRLDALASWSAGDEGF